ncbi:MAG TPA: leucyl aminopeptidase family protein [Aestuariivirgaceae bacterium]|jgi:leucyl aminopeptidase
MTAAKLLLPAKTPAAVPVLCIAAPNWAQTARALGPVEAMAAEAQGFKAQSGRFLLLIGKDGKPSRVLFGLGESKASNDVFLPGKLSRLLPRGAYRLEGDVADHRLAALGWLLEAYVFARYKKPQGEAAALLCPQNEDRDHIIMQAEAVWLARDLINTPACDMGPGDLEQAARDLAARHKAKMRTIIGKPLDAGFPMIAMVGRAAAEERRARLLDMRWGKAGDPKVTLIGKGVCFDTGGLDIKPSAGMLLMKKDMGGAANVLALADMIMTARLPIRLRILVPAVDNAISAEAFRPGDIVTSRKGLSVEIGNTDAEGRLILADALALADEEEPDLLIDLATLTGAARVALGPDLPPFYTDDEEMAEALLRHAGEENDPLWRLPLWASYDRLLESKFADVNNASDSGFAGSIVAALFVKRFVERARIHIHLDIFGWTPVARPGRPFGGEAQGIRALFALIRKRYGSHPPRR